MGKERRKYRRSEKEEGIEDDFWKVFSNFSFFGIHLLDSGTQFNGQLIQRDNFDQFFFPQK